MSRIGKLPIELPQGVSVTVSEKNDVTVKGPLGTLGLAVDPDITVSVEDGTLTVARPSEAKPHRAKHGLYRSLLANLVKGVSEGYTKQLELIGVGYRAEMIGDMLSMGLGFSHPVYFAPPQGVTFATPGKGKQVLVTVTGADKQLVGQVAAKLRSLRPPEPYKGKGIRYSDEYVRRKAGKTAGR